MKQIPIISVQQERRDVILKQAFSIYDFFSLSFDKARDPAIAERIEAGAEVRGTNLIILILSMFIASIGLNMNSTAVVIGAMLISPLMGPIMGIGYGLAIYDIAMAKKSFFRLSMQVFFCLITSALYFSVTPIVTESSELIARTEPTIWDVLIALLGGLAGIIGQTRKELSNVIPGVAIATALMPPLCTAGYGIAQGNIAYFLGAAYLFFINGLCICFATFCVLKIIHFPVKQAHSPFQHKRNRILVPIIVIIALLPSVYTAYQTVIRSAESSELHAFVNNNFNSSERQAIRYRINHQNSSVEIGLIGKALTAEEQALAETDMKQFKYLASYSLELIQNNEALLMQKQEENKTANPDSSKEIAFGNQDMELLQKYKKMSLLYQPAYQHMTDTTEALEKCRTTGSIVFPEIQDMEGSAVLDVKDTNKIKVVKYIIVVYVKAPLEQRDAQKMRSWLQAELKRPVLLTIRLQDNLANTGIVGDGFE